MCVGACDDLANCVNDWSSVWLKLISECVRIGLVLNIHGLKVISECVRIGAGF